MFINPEYELDVFRRVHVVAKKRLLTSPVRPSSIGVYQLGSYRTDFSEI